MGGYGGMGVWGYGVMSGYEGLWTVMWGLWVYGVWGLMVVWGVMRLWLWGYVVLCGAIGVMGVWGYGGMGGISFQSPQQVGLGRIAELFSRPPSGCHLPPTSPTVTPRERPSSAGGIIVSGGMFAGSRCSGVDV